MTPVRKCCSCLSIVDEHYCNRKRRAAFTIIELVVVVSIVAILLSVLLPTLGRTRGSVRRVECLLNLNHVGNALSAYRTDNWQRFPAGNATLRPQNGIDSTYWIGGNEPYGLARLMTGSYLVNVRPLYCPSWIHPYAQINAVDTAGVDIAFGPGEMGGWPTDGVVGPTKHYIISYHYRSTFGPLSNQPAKASLTPSSSAIVADHWVRREVLYGRDYGHGNGYSTLYLDSSARWTPDQDSAYMLANQPLSGGRTNDSWVFQESIWQDFFDK